VGRLGGCVEAAHLEHAILYFAFLALLFGNLLSDGLLNELVLAATRGQLVSRVLASAVVEASGAHQLVAGLSINAIFGVVKDFVSADGVLQVQVLLRDVLFDNSSADAAEVFKGTFLLPVGN